MYNIFMFKKKLFTFLLVAAVFLTPAIPLVQAAIGHECDPNKEVCNPINSNTINEFIKKILEGAIKIGIPIIALAIIYCGFLFVAARGNSEKLKKAKDAITYTLIGAAILLGAWALAQLISETVLSL